MKACLLTTLMFCLENDSANSMHNQQNKKSTQVSGVWCQKMWQFLDMFLRNCQLFTVFGISYPMRIEGFSYCVEWVKMMFLWNEKIVNCFLSATRPAFITSSIIYRNILGLFLRVGFSVHHKICHCFLRMIIKYIWQKGKYSITPLGIIFIT